MYRYEKGEKQYKMCKEASADYCSDCPHGVKEKTSDEMFEELGYEKGEIGIFIQFNNIKELISITFNIKEKTVSKLKGYDEAIPITDKELQAINKKIEELGGYYKFETVNKIEFERSDT